MIGSNMAQIATVMRLTPNICLYDVYEPGLEGVYEELRHCGFDGMDLHFTTDVKEAFTGAKYVVSSGGAPRKAGMTREDLISSNGTIAKELGENVRKYCPDLKHLIVVFNPADITGIIALLHSGLKPSQVTTLAALDSTRLQSELARHFGLLQHEVTGARTYGGHGEQMAVFGSGVKVKGTPLAELVGTDKLTLDEWAEIRQRVVKGGANIIKLRGRSSFQSPAQLSIEMMAAAMGGPAFRWPVGTYVSNDRYDHVMMAWETILDREGAHIKPIEHAADEEMKELDASYKHLQDQIDNIIKMGLIPTVDKWHELNPNIK